MDETNNEIVEVYGLLNGQPLVLYPTTPDRLRWSAIVPRVESGNYIVELYIRDQAGNESHCATAVCDIDEAKLSASITMLAVYLNGALPIKTINTRYRE